MINNLISDALVYLKNNISTIDHNMGICPNLSLVLTLPKFSGNYSENECSNIEHMVQVSLRNTFQKLGYTNSLFPVENAVDSNTDIMEKYFSCTDKFDSTTPYGKVRLKLLDQLIEYYAVKAINEKQRDVLEKLKLCLSGKVPCGFIFDSTQGICFHLIRNGCNKFSTTVFKELGYKSMLYPVESTVNENGSFDLIYSQYKEKYNPETPYGKARLKLLNEMIGYYHE